MQQHLADRLRPLCAVDVLRAGAAVQGAQNRAAQQQGRDHSGRAEEHLPHDVQDASHGNRSRHDVQGKAHPRLLPLVRMRGHRQPRAGAITIMHAKESSAISR